MTPNVRPIAITIRNYRICGNIDTYINFIFWQLVSIENSIIDETLLLDTYHLPASAKFTFF